MGGRLLLAMVGEVTFGIFLLLLFVAEMGR